MPIDDSKHKQRRKASAISIDDKMLKRGLRFLKARDKDLARIIDDLGPPPIWARDPGFPTLVYIILEQQVSLASARAAFNRLTMACMPFSPAKFLEFDDFELKTFGFSRQKTIYARSLAQAILAGDLKLDDVHLMHDDDVRKELVKLKGIGNWTVDIYLLMALLRPNVWPVGDLALAVAIQKVKRLKTRPDPATMEKIGHLWQPWRAVAARVLWQYYLAQK